MLDLFCKLLVTAALLHRKCLSMLTDTMNYLLLQVGTGYFDVVSNTVSAGASSTTALTGSTEAAQFD